MFFLINIKRFKKNNPRLGLPTNYQMNSADPKCAENIANVNNKERHFI